MLDFESLFGFTAATVVIFFMLILRYFLFGCILHWFFYIQKSPGLEKRKLYTKKYTRKQFRNELKWSIISSFIFAFAGSLICYLWQKGFTKIYFDTDKTSLWLMPVSLVVLLLLHETYYYWLHRWMHLPNVYRHIHKVHHDSHVTSPWTSFSFHPLEAFLQALFLPAVLLFVPTDIYVLAFFLLIMTVSGFINHLGYEIYPDGFEKNFFGKWLIGATHHARHHKQYQYNFGLYFRLWDIWKKTEAPATLGIDRNNKAISIIKSKDDRAGLYIVKPRAIK